MKKIIPSLLSLTFLSTTAIAMEPLSPQELSQISEIHLTKNQVLKVQKTIADFARDKTKILAYVEDYEQSRGFTNGLCSELLDQLIERCGNVNKHLDKLRDLYGNIASSSTCSTAWDIEILRSEISTKKHIILKALQSLESFGDLIDESAPSDFDVFQKQINAQQNQLSLLLDGADLRKIMLEKDKNGGYTDGVSGLFASLFHLMPVFKRDLEKRFQAIQEAANKGEFSDADLTVLQEREIIFDLLKERNFKAAEILSKLILSLSSTLPYEDEKRSFPCSANSIQSYFRNTKDYLKNTRDYISLMKSVPTTYLPQEDHLGKYFYVFEVGSTNEMTSLMEEWMKRANISEVLTKTRDASDVDLSFYQSLKKISGYFELLITDPTDASGLKFWTIGENNSYISAVFPSKK